MGECVQCSIGGAAYGSSRSIEIAKTGGIGKFNDLQGQSDESVACKDCGTVNLMILKVNQIAKIVVLVNLMIYKANQTSLWRVKYGKILNVIRV